MVTLKERVGYGTVGALMAVYGVIAVIEGRAGGVPGLGGERLRGIPARIAGVLLCAIGLFVLYKLFMEKPPPGGGPDDKNDPD